MMIAVQIRMARAALGWGVRDLAKQADVNANTVTRIETGSDATVGVLTRLQAALERAGVVFLQPGEIKGDGFGVRLLPNIDGWLVNLDEGWARNDRALVSFWHDADGTRSIGPVAPIADHLPKSDYQKLAKSAMAAVSKAIRQRGEGLAQPQSDTERAVKLRHLRAAVDAGLRSGRAADSSMGSILRELDREG